MTAYLCEDEVLWPADSTHGSHADGQACAVMPWCSWPSSMAGLAHVEQAASPLAASPHLLHHPRHRRCRSRCHLATPRSPPHMFCEAVVECVRRWQAMSWPQLWPLHCGECAAVVAVAMPRSIPKNHHLAIHHASWTLDMRPLALRRDGAVAP